MSCLRRSVVPSLGLGLVMALSACAGAGASGPELDRRLLGVWTDTGGSTVTITAEGDPYAVGVVDSDGEVFDVVSVEWDGAALAWTYDVPSTGYRVLHETTRIGADRLDVRWENEFDAGTGVLTRVE